jgi:hypothetical protein
MANGIQRVREYLQQLTTAFGSSWNRFWFTPADPETICLLRILVGLAALYFVASHTADLVVWFGPDGLLPAETVRRLTGMSAAGPLGAPQPVFRWSYLYLMESETLLWSAHVIGMIIVGCFAAGLFSRLAAVLSLIVVLSYVHRAPLIVGPFDAVLPLLLFCLCWGPTGARWSLDQRLRTRRRAGREQPVDAAATMVPSASTAANISQRLLQVHVAALYLLMAATQLAGQVWWAGEAMWWLIARAESRLVDLSFLSQHMVLVNAWTHGIVLFELAFGLLIWHRLARPLLLVLAPLLWLPWALVTGHVSFSLLMLIANACFVSGEALRGTVPRHADSTLGPGENRRADGHSRERRAATAAETTIGS